MSAADYGVFGGLAIALWAGGYASGIFVRAVRLVFERATGVGSL